MILNLETSRLLLRPPVLEDVAALVAALNNINITRMTGRIPFPYSEADAIAFVENCAQSNDQWRFVILDKATNTLRGGVGMRGDELGYWIAESDWGKGIAGEAASAVVSDVFLNSKQEQIIARWRTDNPASGRVLEKLGFEPDGLGSCVSNATGEVHPSVEEVLTRMRWLKSQKRPPHGSLFISLDN